MAKKKQDKNKDSDKSSTKNKEAKTVKSKQRRLIWGGFLVLLTVYLLFIFTSFFFSWQADQSVWADLANREEIADNLGSKIGAYLSYLLMYKGFGIATFIAVWLIFLSGLKYLFNIKIALLNRWYWGTLLMVLLATFLGFLQGKSTILSGVSGYEVNHFLQDYFGKIGTFLILFFFALVYAITKWQLTPEKIMSFFQNTFTKLKREHDDEQDDDFEDADDTPSTTSSDIITDNEEEQDVEIVLPQVDDEKIDPFTHKKEIPFLDGKGELEITNIPEDEAPELTITPIVPPVMVDPEDLAKQLVENYGEYDPRLDLSDYRFPTIELLNEPKDKGIIINEEELKENNDTIIKTLADYKIEISKIKATVGPTVTLYEIVPVAGTRIAKIKSLEDDIALSLAALGIRIIAPIPGKGTIGIEVPNKKPTMVYMRSMITAQKFQNAEMELPIAFGKTISNETFVADLTKMPHLLMAGATGQGKSVGINVVLTSLLYKKHPAEVKFVLVDPKKVELSIFETIERHFLAKLPDSEEAIITDNKKVVNTLNSLCIEMDNRYELLKNAQVRNIKEYNAKFKARQLNPNEGHRFLPYIVLVVDEFADLIMTAGKEVELPIARLAQLARAIGIHLIIATQRPSTNVITGIIKANFPTRVAFKVSSKIDSKIILDGSGAEQLIGRGDMLYSQGNEPVRIQCAFVDTPEIQHITEFIGAQRAYPDAYLLPEYVGPDSEPVDLDFDPSERDPMFREAAEVVVNAQQGSASLLQRKLKLGYNRAGRLIDQLEHAGVVGPFEGSKARQVLVQDITSLDRLLGGNE
ncbi:DNA translocase FtsK 4TM domain-containing protein [Capnocytophaga genosp. AHN8471]|uniref:DNA translocase FtsK 4TM domain-containing protein n=1 Tax=Capnocytophaga genosp. AHN8471 TaxID=327574 RepID=A0ABS1YTP6_9FLAO|nr:DNA translocase FtsK [Capnocytophaga genosp. AHN8471]MBM0649400.1 DNA translocase FtsK 4TM domain-containing protein [Capnocytophaga genosp. AHN8471]MBM0661254.1 DNA translocase FtsK 4TM domain-containing protein [Capnocytophaga genosp. AHN8471]